MTTPFPSPPDPPAGGFTHAAKEDGPPRVLLYSSDIGGLGHLRHTLAVAEELARRRPDAGLLLLTGSLHGFGALPANLDYVKLPATQRREVYRGLPPWAGRAESDGLTPTRTAIIEAAVETFAPDLVYVDDEPIGYRGELVSALSRLRRSRPAARLVLGLRDIISSPATTRPYWQAHGVYQWLDQGYDRILVHGDARLFDPVRQYDFSPTAAARTLVCGYIRRDEALRSSSQIRAELGAASDQPLVVVTVGGGDFGQSLLLAYVEALRSGALPGVASLLITGPILDAETRRRVEVAAAELPAVTVLRFTPDVLSYFNAADLVVAMCGYNTVCDILGLGKRAVFAPYGGEQLERARLLAERGLGRLLDARAPRAPEELSRVVRQELSRPPAPVWLDFGGLARTGDELSALLPAPQAITA